MPSKVLKKLCRVWFLYTNLASFHKMLISSEAMRHPIRMLDMVLEHLKVILLVFESRRNIRVSLGNTWSTSVDPIVDQKVWKYEYYAHIWARVVLKYEFLWPIFFRNSKIWIISFQTHYQPCFYDIYLCFYTLRHIRSQILKKREFLANPGLNLASCLIYIEKNSPKSHLWVWTQKLV